MGIRWGISGNSFGTVLVQHVVLYIDEYRRYIGVRSDKPCKSFGRDPVRTCCTQIRCALVSSRGSSVDVVRAEEYVAILKYVEELESSDVYQLTTTF